MDNFSLEMYDNFFEAVLRLESIEDARRFFEDVLTVKELESISQRLKVASMLRAGCNYQEVSRASGASTATISRVNKCLMYGSGGYDLVLSEEEK